VGEECNKEIDADHAKCKCEAYEVDGPNDGVDFVELLVETRVEELEENTNFANGSFTETLSYTSSRPHLIHELHKPMLNSVEVFN
jgi:hypothetical protein